MQPDREFLVAGRLGRGGFWLRHAIGLPIALFLCIALDSLIGSAAGTLAALATSVWLVAVWGRRLHDRGRSAWWLLTAAVPVLGALFLIVECGFLPARSGAARFGAPLGLRADYAVVRATPSGGMP